MTPYVVAAGPGKVVAARVGESCSDLVFLCARVVLGGL